MNNMRKGTNHEPNNLKLQTNKQKKPINNKHTYAKTRQNQVTKTQKQGGVKIAIYETFKTLSKIKSVLKQTNKTTRQYLEGHGVLSVVMKH